MIVAVSADHAGYTLKSEIVSWLKEKGHQIDDLGAFNIDPDDDYPDFALAVASSVSSGQAERGIVVCGSGVGASIAANKIPGVRAGMCHDTYSAHQGVEHDDMNVLCLGSGIVGLSVISELLHAFLSASFDSREPRYVRRLSKVKAIEDEVAR